MTPDHLAIDCKKEAERISALLKKVVHKNLRRGGAVVGLSGGIDSSVTAALCVKAFGGDKVLGLLMPEKDSSPATLDLSRRVADALGIQTEHEDISGILESAGCYRRQADAVRRVFPKFTTDDRFKIVLPGILDQYTYRLFSVVVRFADGHEEKKRLTPEAYLELVAATNFKQRTRKMLEYYHADRLNYVVAGTPNRLEHDQGFFVKLGDGAADVKPIAHLYKTQVYALAGSLGVPEEVCCRPPTTDTYSLAQSQEEFFFSLPYREMDLCLYGRGEGMDPKQVASIVGLTPEQVERVFQDIDAKRKAARYLHAVPVMLEGGGGG